MYTVSFQVLVFEEVTTTAVGELRVGTGTEQRTMNLQIYQDSIATVTATVIIAHYSYYYLFVVTSSTVFPDYLQFRRCQQVLTQSFGKDWC